MQCTKTKAVAITIVQCNSQQFMISGPARRRDIVGDDISNVQQYSTTMSVSLLSNLTRQ